MDLGLERAGLKCLWQVENNPYCNTILEKHWPQVKRYGDIKAVYGSELERVDVLAGGFPCVDVSRVGLRAGIDAERSGLWAEFFRLVREIRPSYVLVENVPGLLDGGLGRVLGDLAAGGYDAEWRCLSAAQFGLPHVRERVFIVAYPRSSTARGRWVQRVLPATLPDRAGFLIRARERGVNGLSRELDRLKGYGNAVVPDCAEWLGRRLVLAMEQENNAPAFGL